MAALEELEIDHSVVKTDVPQLRRLRRLKTKDSIVRDFPAPSLVHLDLFRYKSDWRGIPSNLPFPQSFQPALEVLELAYVNFSEESLSP